MSNPANPYEPLTSENSALVLVDHQVGLMTGVRDYSIAELKHNVVGLAKAAKVLKLPIVVTTTARDSMWGPTFPESKLCPGCKSSTAPLSMSSMIRASHAPSKRLAEGN
jgi:nicotinamidase-related amidase